MDRRNAFRALAGLLVTQRVVFIQHPQIPDMGKVRLDLDPITEIEVKFGARSLIILPNDLMSALEGNGDAL